MTTQTKTVHSTYTWRPIQQSDIIAIREMTAAAVEVDKSEGSATEESLNQIFQILGERVETNTQACIAPDGNLAAIAFFLTRPGEAEYLAMIDGHVHVDHRRKGLGSYILGWLESRARERPKTNSSTDEGNTTTAGSPELPEVLKTAYGPSGTPRLSI